ncbi:DNA-binding HxlR family transcriptional regulator [Crossiella equi]|uniref:DNA-binding HxlR family transcriptional regulator n=1 Tax=Crossiella equi TaxID=130796 RepID=A0ABS5ANQ2_9PSEU|nr:helix-turn-helix domain-containing protein [Crossiella equi]MBP2478215.1 DNA-binding HxlR family transcriptional regulator [Crossiella equi]
MTSPRTCSVARTLSVVGERWSLLVLREVMLGVRRFEAIRQHTGAPRAVLTERLRSLEEAGVLERREYREEGARTRYEYRPTEAGRELQPVLTALMQWGDRHLGAAGDPDWPPLRVAHRGECGGQVRAVLTCEHGHRLGDDGRELDARPSSQALSSRAGPAATPRPRPCCPG